jgi:hypothetical protein
VPGQAFVGAHRSAVEIARKLSELLFMSREMKERAAARSDDSPGAGSLPGERIISVHFTPKSRHVQCTSRCLLWPKADIHSITSSARNNTDTGTASPIAFAVVRLITKSNLVGCSTGISPGLARAEFYPHIRPPVFWSKADICNAKRPVRFTLESGHLATRSVRFGP